MAKELITFGEKVDLNELSEIDQPSKITASDINSLRGGVNELYNSVGSGIAVRINIGCFFNQYADNTGVWDYYRFIYNQTDIYNDLNTVLDLEKSNISQSEAALLFVECLKGFWTTIDEAGNSLFNYQTFKTAENTGTQIWLLTELNSDWKIISWYSETTMRRTICCFDLPLFWNGKKLYYR